MARRKEFDSKKLIEEVKKGTEQKEILDKFGFNNSTQLKVAYANALMETGEAPEIKTGVKDKSAGDGKKEIKVNKRGSLVIPKEMVEEMGFEEGASFQLRKTKAGVSLKQL